MKAFFSALLLSAASLSAAPDELWIGMVNGTKSGSVARALENYLPQSQDALQLSGLDLVDTEKEPLVPGESSTAKFKGGYTLHVKCLERRAAHYSLALTLGNKDGGVLTSQVEIARDQPIILAGPTSADGRLLFFVVVR
jgi:hypothetical protein